MGYQGQTALHLAARAGYLDFVKFLLDVGAYVNQKGTINKLMKYRRMLLWKGGGK